MIPRMTTHPATTMRRREGLMTNPSTTFRRKARLEGIGRPGANAPTGIVKVLRATLLFLQLDLSS